jgi:hypothetical protein
MAYGDFTLTDLQEKLGISNQERNLFLEIQPVEPSAWLVETLQKNQKLPLRSEKAKSEGFIFPILTEICEKNAQEIIFYSGENLQADIKKKLVGECDFIISKNKGSYVINTPIFAMVEAKKNDFDAGIPQCAAQMVGAKIYNQKMQTSQAVIYGCVTTAEQWLFLKLENDIIYIDKQKYSITSISTILGLLQQIVNESKN